MVHSIMKSKKRIYSNYTIEALQVMAGLIKTGRKEKKQSMQDVADRAGISRGLLRRIENGDVKCEVGVVFEVASIVGVNLFESDEHQLAFHRKGIQEKLSLMPKSVRKASKQVDDDF